MDYIVVSHRDKEVFTESVKSLLSKGYILQGGISTIITKNEHIQYFQAMYFELGK